MFSFSIRKTGPIGLDIGCNSIRMIQLADSGSNIQVVAADKVEIAHDICADPEARRNFIIASVKEMLANGNYHGREVVTSLPNDSLKIKSLRLDIRNTNEIEELLRKEIANRFELNADVDEIRYMVAGSVHQGDEIKKEVIFFGTGKENITDHISLLEKAGLIPVAIDAMPCALFRSLQASLRRHEDQREVNVFVDVGSLVTTVIIGKGRQITFVKQIPVAKKHLIEEVASGLGISTAEAITLRAKLKSDDQETIDPQTREAVMDAVDRVTEKLAKEVSLCFRYYAVTFRGERPNEVAFAGAEAALLSVLKKHLGVEIKIAQPLRGFDLSRVSLESDKETELCEWAVAVGLGIKGWNLPVYGMESYERN